MRSLLVLLVNGYTKWISPLLGAGKCRFYPSCSAYTAQVIQRHGVLKGMALGLKRILKCHPWHNHGFYDNPPEEIDWQEIIGYKSSDLDGRHNHKNINNR